MGREIEKTALERGHHIVAVIDHEDDWQKKTAELRKAQLAIEFSLPEAAVKNIKRCFDLGIAVVTGTTGWYHSFPEVEKACLSGGHSLFYASNFSPGMNIMFELNKKMARFMAGQKNYRILIEEIHHSGKKDAPSGSAISLANDIIKIHPEKLRWVNKPSNGTEELEIISLRRNHVPGTHFVKYDSDIDSLEIRHTAHSRKGFATGALMAAEWLAGRKGCFTMPDLLYDM